MEGRTVMDLLAAEVPITLLVDLLLGPELDSAEIARREGGSASWLPPAHAA